MIESGAKVSRKALLVVFLAGLICQTFATAPGAVSKPLSAWEVAQNRGARAFEDNEFGIAERSLKDAELQARAFGSTDLRLARSAGELGRLLTVRGRFAEAQPFLEEELHVKEAAAGDDYTKLIPAMGSLVKFYLSYGTAIKANSVTEEILDFVEGKLKAASSAAQAKSKLQKGQPLEGWAGTAAPVMRDPLIEWAITCDDLGNQYSAHGKYELADRLFKDALDVKATVLGKQHLSLANSYDSLGSLCMARNEDGDAESYFEDALEITEKIQGPANPQVYSRLDKLAKCLVKEGKYQEAEQLYLRARNFWKNETNRAGSEARADYALGSLYLEERKYSSAANVLGRALTLAEQSSGAYSVSLVPYLERYAYAIYHLGRSGEAARLRARAKIINPVIPELAAKSKMQLGVWTDPDDPRAKPGVTSSKHPIRRRSSRTSRTGGSYRKYRLSRGSRSPRTSSSHKASR